MADEEHSGTKALKQLLDTSGFMRSIGKDRHGTEHYVFPGLEAAYAAHGRSIEQMQADLESDRNQGTREDGTRGES